MKREDFEKLVGLVDDLSQEQRDLVKQALEGENDLGRVVSIIENRLAAKRECTYCHSENVKKWAKSRGLQRYRCYDCGKTFNSLTNSPLALLRKRDRWLKMALSLKDGLSLRKTAARCGVSVPTAFRWRHRFLKAAAAEKPINFESIPEDETLLP
jgi:transposase-like protein